jgi:hypothetical protein
VKKEREFYFSKCTCLQFKILFIISFFWQNLEGRFVEERFTMKEFGVGRFI